MRALLITVGSQGDVRPFAALARRLRVEGHDVVLAAPAIYQGLANGSDVAFAPLDLDMTEVGHAVAGRHGLRHLFAFARAMGQRAGKVLPGVSAAATGHGPVDVIVHHPVLPIGQHVGEMLGVPAIVASPSPVLVPTREFPSPAWPGTARTPAPVNRASYRAARYLTGAWCRRDIDHWRDSLGLGRRPGRHDPLHDLSVTVLHSFSRQVVPPPADWPATAHVTGYWFPQDESAWTPPARLTRFLDSGTPPVYLGFGSMPTDNPAALAEVVSVAARQTGMRFIVRSLDPELRRLLTSCGDRILIVRETPHEWLFARTAVVVHHGGAGTTGTSIAAGCPQVIWPFGVDQHFWADRVAALGVAVPAGPVRTLTGSRLARAVEQAVGDPGLSRRAQNLASRVRAEDGVGQAVAHIERLARGAPVAMST